MPRCAEPGCGRWRPERLAPRWAAGIRFNEHWYCSRTCVERAARAGLAVPAIPAAPAAALPPLKVGVLLRHLGAISARQLDDALQMQKSSSERLGVVLRRMGAVSPEVLLRALAAQSGASYLPTFDVARIVPGPAWMTAATVAALGLVPFEGDDATRTLRVVCPAPVPRPAVRALIKLSGWTVEPYIVDDDVWPLAVRAYRPADAGSDRSATVTDVAAAAARIADAAFTDRAITMRHASFGGHTWVSVVAPGRLSDLLVMDKEAECQAEHIAR
jgi:hypothetical protein